MNPFYFTLSLLVSVTLSSAAPLAAGAAEVRFDAGTISGLSARNIGSAMMSGRVSAVAAVPDGGSLTVYVGAASGGVWKSVNGGSTFRPIFDHEDVQSIGAIAIDPSHPKTIWVGTGESWTRNSVSVGDGVYKSTDGGETWTNVGLADSERISKIIVDPKESDTAYVCAVGHLWNDNETRGVYKTTDGGAHWEKILGGANASTGCAMLTQNPKNPSILYASLWDFRREASTFRSGGIGSGLFRSADGGKHWTELTPASAKGLPPKPYGRIAVSVAPSKPSTIYATIEARESALYRSDDDGKNWIKLDASQRMVWRPFYFSNLAVDPKDENRVFKPNLVLLLSTDGGKSFNPVSNSAHGDFHDIWIHPENPKLIYAGDDGGLWRSLDGGSTWEHLANLPISQFYHVSVDRSNPYRVYGGLQDNSSWVGDSSYPGGVSNSRWENLYGGDGFWTWEDPSDSNYVYAESQGGDIGRIQRFTHQARSIKPYARYGEKKLRFNWNAPIQMSPNEKGTIYLGSQYLYRSRNHGESWDRISPDLTTNDPEKQKQEESGGITVDNSSAEMNTTIYSISESPRDRKVIWVGTDDGNLQVTRDGAKTWTNVTAHLPDLSPRATRSRWITWVEASRFNSAVAYATVDYHTGGDLRPHVVTTADYGKTWRAFDLETSGVRGYAHVIREDTINPNLLFLGTEFGLWISNDRGTHWAQYQGSGFPAVAVRDLVVHPRESDLVIATHGRGIWIIDDLSPLRALTPALMKQDVAFLPFAPAVQTLESWGGWAEGDNAFIGPNRPKGALIPYYQRTRHIFGDLKIEIFDARGKSVGTVPTTKHRGLNRAIWTMHLKPPHVPPAASALFEASIGPRVLPGRYNVKMTKNDQTYVSTIEVVPDPRTGASRSDREKQFELATRLVGDLNHMSWAVDAILKMRDESRARAQSIALGEPLRHDLEAFADSVDQIRSEIVATKEGGAITGEERLREFMGRLYGDVNGYDGRPTKDAIERAETLERELKEVVDRFQMLVDGKLAELNPRLASRKLARLEVNPESKWRESHSDEDGGGKDPDAGGRERFERD